VFPHFDIRETIIAEYLSDASNRRVLRSFASSPEGRKIIEDYLNSPEGPKMLQALMPLILEHIDVPEETKEHIISALKKTE
jgi:hypothetical protein